MVRDQTLTGGLKRKLREMGEEECIQFAQANPHKRGTTAYDKYEGYKGAQTIKMFRLMNKDAINRYKDWQYAIDHKCVTRLGPVSLTITIYDGGTLVDETSWVCDNRFSQADLLSMLEDDFGHKFNIEAYVVCGNKTSSYLQPARLCASTVSLAQLGIGATLPEARICVSYPQAA